MNLIDTDNGEIIGQTEGMELALMDDKFKFLPTGLVVNGNPTFEEWEQCGKLLAHIQKRVHWWIGDWLNYGEHTYGEKYAQALDETGYSYSTLATDKWVTGKIETSRRRENLRFSHHREVASLPAPEQDKWLNKAEKENLGPKDLRREIRRERMQADVDDTATWSVNMVFNVPVSLNGKLEESLERLKEYLWGWNIECRDLSIRKDNG
jgi:hypothetical protein